MENHLLLYKKKKMDPIVHRVTGSYLGFERKNIEKKERHGGRKWRHSSSYGNLHARTDVFFARGKTQAAHGQPETDDGPFG